MKPFQVLQRSVKMRNYINFYFLLILELGVSVSAGYVLATSCVLCPGVPCSKPLGCSKVDSAFHLSEVDKMSTTNFWNLVVKSNLPPRSGSSLEAVEPHP